MANRIHAAETYKVEWGNGIMSSLDSGDVNALFNEMCEGVWFNGDSMHYSDELEIPMDSLESMIGELKGMSDDEFKNECHLTSKGGEPYPREQFIKDLEYLLESADKNNDFVRLSWY